MYDFVLLLMHSMNGLISDAPRAQFRPRLKSSLSFLIFCLWTAIDYTKVYYFINNVNVQCFFLVRFTNSSHKWIINPSEFINWPHWLRMQHTDDKCFGCLTGQRSTALVNDRSRYKDRHLLIAFVERLLYREYGCLFWQRKNFKPPSWKDLQRMCNYRLPPQNYRSIQ